MPQHENKQCSRCHKGFECESGSILLCQCSKIEMSAEQIEYTKIRYTDCLCLSCLKELQVEFSLNSQDKNNCVKRS